jgi:hypothetical protein
MTPEIRRLLDDLRSRTWLAPVSAAEMNHRDRWLADHIEALLAVPADLPPTEARQLLALLWDRVARYHSDEVNRLLDQLAALLTSPAPPDRIYRSAATE